MMSAESQNNPIIIYTMGKVGSISVYESLLALKLNCPIYHTHNLTEDDIVKLQEAINNGIEVAHHSQAIDKIKQLRHLIYANNGKRYRIITLVRDPIAWSISAFFQSMGRKFPQVNLEDDLATNLKKVQEIFELRQEVYYTRASTWFDVRIKDEFGIDVFLTDFPKEKGYNIYRNDHIDLLLIKLESFDECYYQAFKEFLDLKLVDLVVRNQADDKEYKLLYRAFIKSVRLSPDFIKQMYSIPYVQCFYSQDEIDWLKLKWTHPRIRAKIEQTRSKIVQKYEASIEYWQIENQATKANAEHWKAKAKAAQANAEHWKAKAKAAQANAARWKAKAKLSIAGGIKRRVQWILSVFKPSTPGSAE